MGEVVFVTTSITVMIAIKIIVIATKRSMKMTKDEFWQTMVDNMQGYDCAVVCPVKMYANEHNIEPLCHKFEDCVNALKALEKILED